MPKTPNYSNIVLGFDDCLMREKDYLSHCDKETAISQIYSWWYFYSESFRKWRLENYKKEEKLNG